MSMEVGLLYRIEIEKNEKLKRIVYKFNNKINKISF